MTGSIDSRSRIVHPLPPVYASDSVKLILGTLPSVRSRADAFYYAHPQNRFWPLIAALFGETCPADKADKIRLLRKNRIALWDVVQSCDITASADSTIRQVTPNDIAALIQKTRIRQVFTNGTAASRLYRKHCLAATGIPDFCLPSTSPANARNTLQGLIQSWQILAKELEKPLWIPSR